MRESVKSRVKMILRQKPKFSSKHLQQLSVCCEGLTAPSSYKVIIIVIITKDVIIHVYIRIDTNSRARECVCVRPHGGSSIPPEV